MTALRLRGIAAFMVLAAACSSPGAEPPGPMMTLLDQIPAEAQALSGGEEVFIELGDYAAIADATETQRPEADDASAWLAWNRDVTAWFWEREDPTRFMVAQSRPLGPFSLGDEETQRVLGFAHADIETYASVLYDNRKNFFTVMSGDIALSPELERSGEVLQTGPGEDLEITDPSGPFLRPVRLAQRDGLTVASELTAPLNTWLSEDWPTLAEDAAFSRAVTALDEVGVPAAVLVERDFTADESALTPLEDRFEVLGLGYATFDGAPGNVFVYVYESDAAAARARDDVEDVWRNSVVEGIPLTPIADIYDLVSVEQRDSVVVAQATIRQGFAMPEGLGLLSGPFSVSSHR